jgi:hypothetical protein
MELDLLSRPDLAYAYAYAYACASTDATVYGAEPRRLRDII